MQFRGKLTTEDLDDARKLGVPKMRWPRILLKNWYLVLLVCALSWTTISRFEGEEKSGWWALGLMWVAIFGLASRVSYRVKTAKARQLARLKVRLPDWVTLTEDGVNSVGPGRATSFQPWENFKSWHEGCRVILVQRKQGGGVLILPVADLSDATRLPVRKFLQSHIGPAGSNERG